MRQPDSNPEPRRYISNRQVALAGAKEHTSEAGEMLRVANEHVDPLCENSENTQN